MASRKLIILSLFLLPISLLAETASDYVHRGAQKYIFGEKRAAKAEVTAGLAKFPDDPELQQMAGLFRDEKENEQQNKQSQKDQQQSKQEKDQQKQGDQEQSNQKDQSGGEQRQKSEKEDNQSQAKNEPGQENKEEPAAGETPSPSAQDSDGSDKQDSSPMDQEKPGQSPKPSDQANEAPSPSPGEGQGAGTSPTPGPSPGKKMAGEVKAGGEEKPDQNAQTAQVAEAEPEKEGEMSEKQAELLLRSMKDEERRVQLDERKPVRPVYNDW